MFLLNEIEAKKQQELQEANGHMNLHDVNDEVIRKTRQYLQRFVQVKEVDVSKRMRDIAKQHGIPAGLCIQIMDLGLRDYDEAVSLYPELKSDRWSKESVQQLIDQIKLNAN